MADKKLCSLVKAGFHKDDLKAYKNMIHPGKFVCKKCGRAATRSKYLCKSTKL